MRFWNLIAWWWFKTWPESGHHIRINVRYMTDEALAWLTTNKILYKYDLFPTQLTGSEIDLFFFNAEDAVQFKLMFL